MRNAYKTTKMRKPISVGVTLRYLVTGDAHVTIAASYRMSPTTVGRIVKETCAVIWNVLCDKEYVSPPSSEEAWKKFRQVLSKGGTFLMH